MTALRLITSAHPPADLDTAVSSAILQRVAAGEIGPTLRIFTPGRIVAFGRQDRTRPGYRNALEAVRAHGFEAVERLAGGRAAVFHEGTIAFAWAAPESDAKLGIEDRFRSLTDIVVSALDALGLRGEVGEVPGEYCPGRFSVHVGGRKVMGVGQRLVSGASHVGGVLVVHSPHLVNLPLVDAYRHLEYDWDPTVTGSLADSTRVTVADTSEAFVEAVTRRGHHVTATEAEEATLALARRLAADHAAR